MVHRHLPAVSSAHTAVLPCPWWSWRKPVLLSSVCGIWPEAGELQERMSLSGCAAGQAVPEEACDGQCVPARTPCMRAPLDRDDLSAFRGLPT